MDNSNTPETGTPQTKKHKKLAVDASTSEKKKEKKEEIEMGEKEKEEADKTVTGEANTDTKNETNIETNADNNKEPNTETGTASDTQYVPLQIGMERVTERHTELTLKEIQRENAENYKHVLDMFRALASDRAQQLPPMPFVFPKQDVNVMKKYAAIFKESRSPAQWMVVNESAIHALANDCEEFHTSMVDFMLCIETHCSPTMVSEMRIYIQTQKDSTEKLSPAQMVRWMFQTFLSNTEITRLVRQVAEVRMAPNDSIVAYLSKFNDFVAGIPQSALKDEQYKRMLMGALIGNANEAFKNGYANVIAQYLNSETINQTLTRIRGMADNLAALNAAAPANSTASAMVNAIAVNTVFAKPIPPTTFANYAVPTKQQSQSMDTSSNEDEEQPTNEEQYNPGILMANDPNSTSSPTVNLFQRKDNRPHNQNSNNWREHKSVKDMPQVWKPYNVGSRAPLPRRGTFHCTFCNKDGHTADKCWSDPANAQGYGATPNQNEDPNQSREQNF